MTGFPAPDLTTEPCKRFVEEGTDVVRLQAPSFRPLHLLPYFGN